MTKQELKQKRLLERRSKYKKEIDNNDKEIIKTLYLVELKYPTYIRDKLKIDLSVLQNYIKESGLEKIKLENSLKRQKETNLKRYGVECTLNNEEVKEKIKQTLIEKYGVDNPLKSKEIQEKIKETNLEKYGSRSPLGNKEVQSKIEKTNLKKYGVKKPLSSKEIHNKTKETKLDRYGVYYVNSEKAKETNLKKYGVNNPAKCEFIKEKIKETNLEKYGVPYYCMSDNFKEKTKETNFKKYGTEKVFMSDIIKEKIKETNLEKYGVPYYCMLEECRDSTTGISKINKDISDMLFNNKINNKFEFHINSYSYDIHILDTNILLEVDPVPYHNVTWHPFNKVKSKEYHQQKSKVAQENGYQCIHIWDWDDLNKIISMVNPNKEIIYARRLKVREVDKDLCNLFLDRFHLQGSCRGQGIRLGLFDETDTLIQIMTFGKPRYNKNYEYELLRLCSIKKVVGGSKKLFKYFLDNYNPKSIISYCDNSKFTGNVYKELGFTLESYGKPNKHWYNVKTKQHITNNLLLQRGYDQLFKTSYGKGTSNEQLMLENGFVEIYDCGQSTWIYKT